MDRDKTYFLLLNIGHFLDHLFTLVFATVAALVLYREWNVSYAELLAYATPGFFAFGLFSVPAGWIADKWSKDGMMCVFFIGIGLASIATGFAQTPLQIGIGLFVIGMFAAIYHPVGLAIVTMKWKNTGMRIAVNGVWGNLGVAAAALITGYLIDFAGWQMAFILPGAFSILMGVCYMALRRVGIRADREAKKDTGVAAAGPISGPSLGDHSRRHHRLRDGGCRLDTLPIDDLCATENLRRAFAGSGGSVSGLLESLSKGNEDGVATVIGALAFVVFAVASLAQVVVGSMLDKYGPRNVYMVVAAIQIVFFAIMPGLTDGYALAVAFGFMLGAFGQIPINDYMIGKTASGAYRARIYGVRYVVSFTVLAASLPMIAFVYDNWGFDTLFWILAAASIVIMCAVLSLPKQLPQPDPAPAEY